MAFDVRNLPDAVVDFLEERHLATLTIVRPDGSPHVTPVGFSWDSGSTLARVITWAGARKTSLLDARPGSRVALCQVDGGRWLTLEGSATVTADPDRCAEAVERYAVRYRPPGDRGSDRRAVEIRVDRMLGRA